MDEIKSKRSLVLTLQILCQRVPAIHVLSRVRPVHTCRHGLGPTTAYYTATPLQAWRYSGKKRSQVVAQLPSFSLHGLGADGFGWRLTSIFVPQRPSKSQGSEPAYHSPLFLRNS